MGLFGLKNKLDSNIKGLIPITAKRKIPVIICYRDNPKSVRIKILYNNGKIKYEYEHVKAIACDLSPISVDKLCELPEITYALYDYRAELCLKSSCEGLGVKYARVSNLSGRGIGIGLVDTGVFPHPDLTSKKIVVDGFIDLINNYEKPYDDNGHGTFMAGCIAGALSGVAPDANIYAIKAFNLAGKGRISDIIRAIELIIEKKSYKNIKLLCLPFEIPYLGTPKVNPLEDIIKKALSENITVVTPSGNFGPEPYSIYCPGNIKEVITVGGCSYSNSSGAPTKVSDFSGRGPTHTNLSKPDVVAPAFNVTSLASNTNYRPGVRLKPLINTPYTTMSGSSIACALITGVCALILESNPILKPSDIKSILNLSSASIGENKLSQGTGMVFLEKIFK